MEAAGASGGTATEEAAYEAKIAAVRKAQQAGRITAGMDAADLLAMVVATSQAWFGTVGGPAAGRPGGDWVPEQLARHRAAVVESVRRITAPPGTAS